MRTLSHTSVSGVTQGLLYLVDAAGLHQIQSKPYPEFYPTNLCHP